MTAESDQQAKPTRGPQPPVPTVRAVARIEPVPAPTVRASAQVPEAPPHPAPSGGRAAPTVTVSAAAPGRPGPAPNPVLRAPAGRRRRVVRPVVAGLVVALVAAATYVAADRRSGPDHLGRWSVALPAADVVPFAVPDEPAAPEVSGSATSEPAGRPTRIRIRSIGVDSRLEALRLDDDGDLTPPEHVGRAGWYADGIRPGDVGPAVIAGQVNSGRGPGVFQRLRELRAGDRIDVVRGGRTIRFTVVSRSWHPPAEFPTDDVYGPAPGRELRLVTLGGGDTLVVHAVVARRAA